MPSWSSIFITPAGVQVPEAPVAGPSLGERFKRPEGEPPFGSDVDLAVIGTDEEGRLGGQRVAQVADEAVRGA